MTTYSVKLAPCRGCQQERAFRQHRPNHLMHALLEEAARRLRERSVTVEVGAALDQWAYVARKARQDGRWKRLLGLAREVDPDGTRSRLRQTVEEGDPKALRALAASLAVEEMAPPTVWAFASAFGEDRSDDEALVKLLRRAQLRYPNDFHINFQLAARLMGRARSPGGSLHEDGIRYWTAAIAARPQSATAHQRLALALLGAWRWDEAVDAFIQMIPRKPEWDFTYVGLGMALAGRGDSAAAIIAYREAAKQRPRDVTVHAGLGQCLMATGQDEEAIGAFREALQIRPDVAVSHCWLGRLLANSSSPRLRDPKQAISHAQRAVELLPTLAICWQALAAARYRADDWKGTVAALDKSMELSKGGDGIDWYFLAMAQWRLGNKLEARRWYEKAIRWVYRPQTDQPALARPQTHEKELRQLRSEAAALLFPAI